MVYRGLIFCILISLSISVYAQHKFKAAYIINNSGDTLLGTGAMGKSQDYALFRQIGSSDLKKINPGEIKAFREDEGKYYVSGIVWTEDSLLQPKFLEYLVKGKISLFSISKYDRFFIQKQEDSLIELPHSIKAYSDRYAPAHAYRDTSGKAGTSTLDLSKEYNIQDMRYIGVLKYYMQDAPQLNSKLENMGLPKQRELVKLMNDYHKAVCSDWACVNYSKVIPDARFTLELYSGMSRHNDYYTTHYGVMVHYWEPLLSTKLYLKTGLLYAQTPYFKRNFYMNPNYNYHLRIPLSIYYAFGNGSFKPTIGFGWPTGLFTISSLEVGFQYSVTKKFGINATASMDALQAWVQHRQRRLFDNTFGHSINAGLLYKLH